MVQINAAIRIDIDQRCLCGCVQHGIMFDCRCDDMLEAGQHKIIGLGATTGKHDVGRPAPGQHGNIFACAFDKQTRRTAKAVNR